MQTRIGIDFDNTIVCYDRLFHRVCVERGLIPDSIPVNKSDVRDHLRKIGREEDWTAMQGYVYGARMAEADAFPGLKEFLVSARQAGFDLCIVSHKTKLPFRGEPYDLHAAAWNWLRQKGIVDHADAPLKSTQVFFEETKAGKLQRITDCACQFFIDDLPEILAEPAFPASTRRCLFDPHQLYTNKPDWFRFISWQEASDQLLQPA